MLTGSFFSKPNHWFAGVIFLFLFQAVQAQDAIPQVTYDVSSQTRYLSDQLLRPEINNSGTVDISLPVYTIACGNFKLPITLNYNTGGIKVSQRPSIVGLGWNLNCGGVITRIVRGGPDEARAIANENIPDPDQIHNDLQNGPLPHNTSYFANYSLLNRSDWNTTGFSSAIQSSGYCYPGQFDYTYPQSLDIDLAPDEFDFMLTNGISGSFYLDHTGKWQVRSNQEIKVVEVDHGGFPIPAPNDQSGWYYTADAIYQIKLMDENGNLYTFGHTTEDPSSIEFSRGPTGPSNILYDQRGFVPGTNIPEAWYLTQVKTTAGDLINLSYHFTFQMFSRLQTNETNFSGSDRIVNFISKSLLTMPMVTKITTSRGETIDFTNSPSAQLDNVITLNDVGGTGPYGCNGSNSYGNACFGYYKDVSWPQRNGQVNCIMNQLDEMKVSYQGAVVQDCKFNYTNSTSSRLHLLSLDFLGNGSSSSAKQTFQFTYNSTSLPGYNSGQEDLLGFYNGTCYFCNVSGVPNFSQLQAAYLPSRVPNASLMAAESLTSITNPYGGTTTYYTEPHDYSSFISAFGHSITAVSGTPLSGGLRIRQIVGNSNDGNSSQRVTNYHYIQNWINNPSGPSSGILYDDMGSTFFSGTATYYQCTHFIGSQRKSGEIPVTYAEVTAEEPGNGATVKKFSDYTTGQTDNPPFLITSGQTAAGFNLAPYAYDDKKLTRGNVKTELMYNSSHQLLKQIDYNYQSDGNETQNYARSVQYIKNIENSANNTVFSFVAYPQYYFNNTLASTTTTEYDYSRNPAISKVSTETYTYDQNHPSKVVNAQIIDSKGNTRSTANFYPFSYATGSGSIYDAMVSQNIVGPVIDEVHKISYTSGGQTQELRRQHNEYAQWNNSGNPFIYPVKKLTTFNGNSVNTSDYAQTDLTFINYDNTQNLLEYIPRNGIANSMEWGYNGRYPTVKIVNAANSLQSTTTPTITTGYANLVWTPTSDIDRVAQFTKAGTGPITMGASFTNYPGSGYISFAYDLTGASHSAGHLCLSDYANSAGCVDGSYLSLDNLPPGDYTLTLSPGQDFSDGSQIFITYPVTTYITSSSGIKEFFNENFEENTSAGVASGAAHTGVRYFNGNYYVGFTPPNSRKYTIQWWSLVNGSWNFHEQAYTGPITLSGILDDVRVFPSDAQMNTYTYQPSVGITSELDPAGHCTTYEYDNLNRISIVRDQDKNIVKKFCYNYAGQPMTCSVQ